MNIEVLQLEGNVNDLLTVDNKRNVKMTRLIPDYDDKETTDDEEIIDVAITSVDPTRTHPFFNEKLLGKKIRVTIDVVID